MPVLPSWLYITQACFWWGKCRATLISRSHNLASFFNLAKQRTQTGTRKDGQTLLTNHLIEKTLFIAPQHCAQQCKEQSTADKSKQVHTRQFHVHENIKDISLYLDGQLTPSSLWWCARLLQLLFFDNTVFYNTFPLITLSSCTSILIKHREIVEALHIFACSEDCVSHTFWAL